MCPVRSVTYVSGRSHANQLIEDVKQVARELGVRYVLEGGLD